MRHCGIGPAQLGGNPRAPRWHEDRCRAFHTGSVTRCPDAAPARDHWSRQSCDSTNHWESTGPHTCCAHREPSISRPPKAAPLRFATIVPCLVIRPQQRNKQSALSETHDAKKCSYAYYGGTCFALPRTKENSCYILLSVAMMEVSTHNTDHVKPTAYSAVSKEKVLSLIAERQAGHPLPNFPTDSTAGGDHGFDWVLEDGFIWVTLTNPRMVDEHLVTRLFNQLTGILSATGRSIVLIDFSQVRFLGTITLGQLIRFEKLLRVRSGCLQLCGIRDEIRPIFSVTRLDEYFTIHQSFPEAQRDFYDLALRPASHGAKGRQQS